MIQVKSSTTPHLKVRPLGRLTTEEGKPNVEVLEELFDQIDENQDGYLSHSELRAMFIGFISYNKNDSDDESAVESIMKSFDTTHDGKVDLYEFIRGLGQWIEEANNASKSDVNYTNFVQMESDEGVENSQLPAVIKAILLLLLGTTIAAAFASPLVDAVDKLCAATRIPTFFMSFILLPLATNSSQAVSAIKFARRKTFRSASLTFSELYGAVTMNNLLCLSVFLALVYIRGLTWDFSSEVLVISIVCIVMGVFASVSTTFPLWTSFVAFTLYPFCLVLVYVLDYVFGWS